LIWWDQLGDGWAAWYWSQTAVLDPVGQDQDAAASTVGVGDVCSELLVAGLVGGEFAVDRLDGGAVGSGFEGGEGGAVDDQMLGEGGLVGDLVADRPALHRDHRVHLIGPVRRGGQADPPFGGGLPQGGLGGRGPAGPRRQGRAGRARPGFERAEFVQDLFQPLRRKPSDPRQVGELVPVRRPGGRVAKQCRAGGVGGPVERQRDQVPEPGALLGVATSAQACR
jgi:hypothetical protein